MTSALRVYLPWKDALFPLRPHQANEIQYDSKGAAFIRVLNAGTNRLNKCFIYYYPAAGPTSLVGLVGKTVTGTVRRTGVDFVALLVDKVDGLDSDTLATDLVRMARRYLTAKHVTGWKVGTPRSWSMAVPQTTQRLGPHVSLCPKRHMKDVGRRVTLRIVDVMHWTESSRWVALVLDGPLVDRHEWMLHLSCAQEAS